MVGQNKELACFKVVAEVADRKVHCEEFASEGAVPGFCWLKAFGKETRWLPNVVDSLL